MPDAIATPFRRILVATDFSPAAAAARDHALALGAPVAGVTFLHATILPMPEGAPQPEWMPDEASPRSELMASLDTFAEPARRCGCRVRLLLQDGLPSPTILRAARVMHADLVALGTHGRRGFDRLMGSTAQNVLRRCEAPVLTVSSGRRPRAACVQSILCALGTTDSPSTIALARQLAKSSGAALTCVHVVEPLASSALNLSGDLNAYYESAEIRARGRISAALRAAGAEDADLVIASGNAKSEILRVAELANADLIVMGARDVHPAEIGFFGSTVERIVRDAFCPVLTLRHAVPEPRAPRSVEQELTTQR